MYLERTLAIRMIMNRHTGNRRQVILDSYFNKSAVRVVCFLAEVFSTFYSSCFTLYFCHILRRIYHSKHLSFIQLIKIKYQLNMMYCLNYHSCLFLQFLVYVMCWIQEFPQWCVHDQWRVQKLYQQLHVLIIHMMQYHFLVKKYNRQMIK